MVSIDFTSALYLDMEHPFASLRQWPRLTTGRPAALRPLPDVAGLERSAARLAGAEAAALYPSSLHAMVDVLVTMRHGDLTVDGAAYPIGRRAALGKETQRFCHACPSSLHRLLASRSERPVAAILLDGFCTGCNRPAPLGQILSIAAAHDVEVIVDDTQGFGLLGPHGGGTIARLDRWPDNLTAVASTAKAFGVPAALAFGPKRRIAHLRECGALRQHASPVSAADTAALNHGFELNGRHGACRRARLWRLVAQFRSLLARDGISTVGMPFPVVTIPIAEPVVLLHVQARLARLGITALARRLCRPGRLGLSFILTASHDAATVARAALALNRILEDQDDLQPRHAFA
ncbi:aminotransferase class I/II-fold pyridoxal phosphate-dependent enzyme [Palleronia pelagia]|uniref:Aminotransferase class I and II n=1 Tax=Palleronia pelagia TaxID=387096 RepID=A0A1H8LCD3_9RHOB|nr:aminotransferase class I/II-fold pyridoxal phosphate-dependent enzyme [Palleronia pelagia]SEO02822.1 Aminotransferase class I and II [Palleronia pelagia]